jgi:uncharacterized protein (TIGR03067 family)
MFRIPFLLAVVGCLGLSFANAPAGADGFKKKVDRTLVGAWSVEWAESNGKDLGKAIKATRWVFTATDFTARLPREGNGRFAYHLTQADKKGTIDIEVLQSEWADLGPRKRVYRGIYTLEKDKLKICYGPAYGTEKERPTEFSTKSGSGTTLFILRRESQTAREFGAVKDAVEITSP